jgi:aspartyl-tRNA(Asn)/glutamyl-tRNA(Gln) amidotransferase subunit A
VRRAATPTLPHPACAIGQETLTCGNVVEPTINALVRFTVPFDVSGQPAIALPCGFTSDGLPISLQLAGRPFDEATICRAAHAYESATDWHTRQPPVA